MEEKVQRLLTYQPALADLYNNRPANSSIFLLYQYKPFSSKPIEIRRFYVQIQVESIRISTNILYNCAYTLMNLTSWELRPKKTTRMKEQVNGIFYKIAGDIFIEEDRVYSLSVKRKKRLKRELLFNKYKVWRARANKVLRRCFFEEKIEEVSEELEDENNNV